MNPALANHFPLCRNYSYWQSGPVPDAEKKNHYSAIMFDSCRSLIYGIADFFPSHTPAQLKVIGSEINFHGSLAIDLTPNTGRKFFPDYVAPRSHKNVHHLQSMSYPRKIRWKKKSSSSRFWNFPFSLQVPVYGSSLSQTRTWQSNAQLFSFCPHFRHKHIPNCPAI